MDFPPFKFEPVTEDEIAAIIRRMKSRKATGIDEISAGFIKLCPTGVSSLLTPLINRSFSSRIVPMVWKRQYFLRIFFC